MNFLPDTVRLLARHARNAVLALLAGAPIAAQSLPALSAPTLPAGCEALAVPAGNVVSFRTFAAGFQVYRWDVAANKWTFVEPIALLFPLPFAYPVGVHSVGPTWTVPGAGTVVGSALANHTVDPTAIPWLLIAAVSTSGPGPLAATTFVQRLYTTGGRAPSRVGAEGEVVYVPYTAQYFFYSAQ